MNLGSLLMAARVWCGVCGQQLRWFSLGPKASERHTTGTGPTWVHPVDVPHRALPVFDGGTGL